MEILFNPQDRSPLIIGATGMDAIIQNIRIIILTMAYSVPLDRAFAHDGRMIDAPAPKEAWRRASVLIDAIEKYEPRVKVHKLEFVYSDIESQLEEGQLMPRITFSLKRGVNL